MNVGEYGNVIRFGVGEDISSNTNSIVFTSPYNSNKKFTITSSEGLGIGMADIETPIGTLKALQYLTYTTKAGDFDISGIWEARVQSTTPGNELRKISDKKSTFKVDA